MYINDLQYVSYILKLNTGIEDKNLIKKIFN